MVREMDGKVEFIRSVVPGGASKSFGVQVARMAGLPPKVIERAQSLMQQMEKRGAASKDFGRTEVPYDSDGRGDAAFNF